MALLNPYLQFAGNAREAMEHYRDVLGGQLEINTFGEYGATGGDGPPADGVMHARLTTDLGFTLMASDLPPGAGEARNGSVSISGGADEADTLRGYWEGLSEGSQVEMALEKQMWGDEFGSCTDTYGVNWMVDIGTD